MVAQVNLRGMTVAKLSKRLLDSPAINAEQVLIVSTCVRRAVERVQPGI